MIGSQLPAVVCFGALSLCGTAIAAELQTVPQYHVLAIGFSGPEQGSSDAPARDLELAVTFRHESGRPSIRVFGFWDGDGRGGTRGSVYTVRFCPTKIGRWEIVQTDSDTDQLNGQRQGDSIVCTASEHPGFWIADGGWYRRSDGSHPFIVGNTHYSFLSRHNKDGPVATDPLEDIRRNREFFTKLRFTLVGDRYPDPRLKPFLDDDGKPTDDGRFSYRPNPEWFRERVDPVIAEGHRVDLACDLILCGPDTRESRATLKGDPRPWLRYVAARYGSYPNVWICLANEWDIKSPKYMPDEIREIGQIMDSFLPYDTPISAHAAPGDWKLSGEWHDHVILQHKIKRLGEAADVTARNRRRTGQPVVNDENAYQGDGDNFSEGDTVEGCFGTFLGGGYASTGEKYGNKLGQYFWGGFDADAHTAARQLSYLREYIDEAVQFWRLDPVPLDQTPFRHLDNRCRVLGSAGTEYVLGSNRAIRDSKIDLPQGAWRIIQLDLIAMSRRTLAEGARGSFELSAPDSRAVLTHFVRR